jgi:division protein CdvB (Snf7/Vps24/ESCRT-III family)
MANTPDPIPALVLAAQELEDELRRCEEAVTDAVRVRLSTEKNIGRAGRALKAAADHRDQMGAKVNGLLAAINGARARADEAAARMEKRAGELQARMEQLLAFQGRAADIAVAVRDLHDFAKQAKTPQEILERMGLVEDRVGQAQQEARTNDFDDVAHDIAGLKEMLATLRRKLEGK